MARNNISYKDFGHKRFHFEKAFKLKSDAKRFAKKLKQEGNYVRVIPITHSRGNWGVYSKYK